MFTVFYMAILQLLLLTSPNFAESNEGNDVDSGRDLLPSFTWITSRTLEMRFPDGTRDKAYLRPADKVGELHVPCLYEGVLEREPSAFLAVSGCQNDDVVDIVVYTKRLLPQNMYRIVNGKTEPVEIIAANKNVEEPKRRINRLRKRGIFVGDEYDDYDYEDIAHEGGQAKQYPDPLPFYVFDVRLGFEENFLKLAGSELNARHKIARIFTLGKQHLKHTSLGTSIRLRPQGPITKVNNKNWIPGGQKDKNLIDSMTEKRNEKIPITFFCGRNETGGNNRIRGSSYIRKGCDEKKGVALVEYDDDNQVSAQTYGHETAHWMGIHHDKQLTDKNGLRCEGRGLMSNVSTPNGRPEQWSTCSKERLRKWLSRPKNDCLKEDKELFQLDKGSFAFDCFKWKTHLRSGCDRPEEMLHGEWMCADDGMCFPACALGYKVSHPSGETNIRCFKKQWMINPVDFSCECDATFKIPFGSLSCTGDKCNLICENGYDSSALRRERYPQLTKVKCTSNGWRKYPYKIKDKIDTSLIACDLECKVPEIIPDKGAWEQKDVKEGCFYHLTCAKGYKPSDMEKTIYQENTKDWSIDLNSFKCLECQKPEYTPVNGNWELGDECSYRLACRSGYNPSDMRTTKMEDDNTWKIPLNSFSCVGIAIHGGWSSYGRCSRTCKKNAVQTRTCTNPVPKYGGNSCSGSSSRSCNQNIACPLPGPVYILAGGLRDWPSGFRDIAVYHPTVDNVDCSILPPLLNNDWYYHTTFYHDQTVYLCGGWNTGSICISHKTGTKGWKTHTLIISRKDGPSAVVLNNRLYLIGGRTYYDDNSPMSTSLPLTQRPALTKVPNLNYKGEHPCTAKVDEDTLVVTGGYKSRDTWATVATYNVKTRRYKQLPSLQDERHKHGCVVVEKDNAKWIIVAGGYWEDEDYGYTLDSTEMLKWGGNEWVSLGNLNEDRHAHSMVLTQGGIMVIGGEDNNDNKLTSVELLDWDSKTWSVVQPSLNKPRTYFGGAVEIPASMFGCTG